MKSLKFTVFGLVLLGQLFVNQSAKAELTERQLNKRILCKDAYPKIDEKHLKDCSVGKYGIDQYKICSRLDPSFGAKAFDTCLTAKISIAQKKVCVNLKNWHQQDLAEKDCFSESIKTDALHSCISNLENYYIVKSADNSRISMGPNSTENTTMRDYFSTEFSKKEFKEFISGCYGSEATVISSCFKLFDRSENGALKQISRCFAIEGKENKINKCKELLGKDSSEVRVMSCLEEMYAAELTGAISRVNHSKMSDKKVKKLNNDNRNNQKAFTVRGVRSNKVNGSAGKNH